MKILYMAGGSRATVFSLAPLARAARDEGHEVFMSAPEDSLPLVAGAGLPAYPYTQRTIGDFGSRDRAGNPLEFPTVPDEQLLALGAGYARMAAASLEPLRALSRDWRPDIVVGGHLCYAAMLLGRELGVPAVRQAWDRYGTTLPDAGANAELAHELEQAGLDSLPDPDLFIDICPPSLRLVEPSVPVQMMRSAPANPQARLDPWMYQRTGRRVLVTAGSRAAKGRAGGLHRLAEYAAQLDAELVIAAPDEVAGELREKFPRARVGWFPMDVVVRTCDLVVHHGGGVTGITAINAGVPQLIVSAGAMFHESSQRLAEYGAAATFLPDEVTAEGMLVAGTELMVNPAYRQKAHELSLEVAGLPAPSEVVGVMEDLAAR
ncbi:glycosyltransferase [Streptomyces hygroscopicus]|uniref:glycosyltransferase n=1 Tax=Streptomyces hygroscopicus TaxID=1912 RepID=UPI001FCBB409|nr:glycosyltransferase [Streptomyces hygroscopicus]BDH13432.1 dNTP-hexose glycosyl transferase [Streptomyces hygroscopicus]